MLHQANECARHYGTPHALGQTLIRNRWPNTAGAPGLSCYSAYNLGDQMRQSPTTILYHALRAQQTGAGPGIYDNAQ